MAYLNKETFEIFFNHFTYKTDENYFEVDDLIALPIQVLNRKGYITEFCCSGHSFNKIITGGRMTFRSYITFKEGVALPNLPFGFFKPRVRLKF